MHANSRQFPTVPAADMQVAGWMLLQEMVGLAEYARRYSLLRTEAESAPTFPGIIAAWILQAFINFFARWADGEFLWIPAWYPHLATQSNHRCAVNCGGRDFVFLYVMSESFPITRARRLFGLGPFKNRG